MKVEITKAKQLSKHFCDLKPGDVFSRYAEVQDVVYIKTKDVGDPDWDSGDDDAIVNCINLYTFDSYLFDDYVDCFLFEAKIIIVPVYNKEEK